MVLTLRKDIYFCVANQRAAFLDLSANRYFALPPETDKTFQRFVSGDHLSRYELELLRPLTANGILIDQTAQTSMPISTSCALAHRSFEDVATLRPFALSVFDASLQRIRTAIGMDRSPLCDTVQTIRTNKSKAMISNSAVTLSDVENPLMSYLATRWWLSTQDQCLTWSIGLVQFLSKRHFYPDLVLGIKMRPFAAHAWVQVGDCVLNDNVDRVSQYTPIMVV